MTRARERLLGEEGTIIKDWGGKLAIALIYPNSYFIGMSNLGFHTVYRLFNSYKNIVCERVFWEKDDWIRKPKKVSLESQRPLSDFSLLAFSLTYELDYFNALALLKSSGIPIYSAERGEEHPLVMAGGPCVMANPMPLAPFFDFFCIGEAEAILPSLISLLEESAGDEKFELLKALSNLPGIYVPLYPPNRVKRQWVKSLDDFPVSSCVLTHNTELGELYSIEVERGCPHHCRFCLVKASFSPMRFRSKERILELAREGLRYRRRLGLVGPVLSDYPHLEQLLEDLLKMGASFSLSSLRASPLPQRVVELIAQGGARTITLAPEAGSERLRKVIRKGISEDDILKAVSMVARVGKIKQLKLYFMIGLPSETEEDIEAIVELVLKCKRILDQGGGGCRLDLNIAPFIPKAGTPFQWLGMAPQDVLEQRLLFLKRRLAPQGIKLRSESLPWSEVQAVLARGDGVVGEVLALIDSLSLGSWRKVVERKKLDYDFYAHKRWQFEQILPWAIIDTGTDVGKLKMELQDALLEE